MQTANDNDPCACGQSFVWHQMNSPQHPFQPTGQNVSKDFLGPRRDRDPQRTTRTSQRGAGRPQTVAVNTPWPFDPVLRQALIDKGVLTPDDLRNAEAKIRDMSVVFNQGDRGEGRTMPSSGHSLGA